MSCGQVFILVFLLLFGILPGIIYAVYADSLNKKCPSCGNPGLVPVDSPRGREIAARR
jgi:hypothetical protein